jgi:uncharacterized membrane protein
LAFVGLHFILSHDPVRARLVARAGETGFTVAYSLIAAATLVWAVAAYRAAQAIPLWATPGWLAALALAAMLPATLLFVVGLLTPSPTVVRSEARLTSNAGGGVLAVTRHPFLWGVALWAAIHMAANGDAASLILFGGFLVLAVGGAFHIDARRRAKLGAPWMAYAARTSNIPFVAIIEGRVECPRLEAIGAWRVGVALAFYAAAIGLHRLIGTDPLAGLLAAP